MSDFLKNGVIVDRYFENGIYYAVIYYRKNLYYQVISKSDFERLEVPEYKK